jgi:hypothetical protein
MVGSVIKVSPHILGDVATCDTRGYIRHVKQLTSPGEAIKAIAGSAVHNAVAVYLDPEPIANEGRRIPDALAKFHDTYDAPFARLSAEKLEPALTPQNIHRLLTRWLEMHPASQLPWKRVLMVEEGFVSREWIVEFNDRHEIVLGDAPSEDTFTYWAERGYTPDRVQLIVRPDTVVEDHNSKIRFFDTKTTGWHITDPGWRRSLRLSLQTQLYADAVVQRFGDKAIYGGWINAMEIKNLPASDRKCKDHGRPYAECGSEHAKTEFIECLTTPERVARAVEDAKGYAAKYVELLNNTDIATLGMQGIARDACRFCVAADFCESSRPVHALESSFIPSDYVVGEGKRA